MSLCESKLGIRLRRDQRAMPVEISEGAGRSAATTRERPISPKGLDWPRERSTQDLPSVFDTDAQRVGEPQRQQRTSEHDGVATSADIYSVERAYTGAGRQTGRVLVSSASIRMRSLPQSGMAFDTSDS